MIRAGREVVDRWGVAAAHGLNEHKAKRQKPWDSEGHPQPISSYPQSRGGYPVLWDRQQVEAYAAGHPVEPLPAKDSPEDLLDKFEAADLAEVPSTTWESAYQHGRVPVDAAPCGVPHWHRRTVLDYKAKRDQPQQPHPGGRKVGSRPRRKQHATELEQRIRTLIEEAKAAGDTLTAPKVAEQLGIHRGTAERHLATIRRAGQPAPPRPPRPADLKQQIAKLLEDAEVAGRGEPTGREVSEALGINISTAWKYLADIRRQRTTS